jgi:hypothetical protein
MTDIDHNHGEHAAALRARTLHGQGLMHQQVESAHAGWVRNWREIVDAHGATGTAGGSTTIDDVAPGAVPVPTAMLVEPVAPSDGPGSGDGAPSSTAAAPSSEGGQK